ncbi:MAG TPA: Uma2 family endonuclease [Gemmatimonadaceae bacterium]|nr:Uma2 family endonuclease [Gemmatimonadaceae bacterium]
MGMAVKLPQFTIEDLDRFPDDGNRYEILDGTLLVTPAPSFGHQLIASRIQGILIAALQVPGQANVLGPGAIAVPPRTQLQPDILVVPARFGPRVDWAKVTEHWLAVEVLSRSSRVYDREVKRGAYFALGVRQLWLVDARDRSIDVWRSPRLHRVEREMVRWRAPGVHRVLTLDLAEVFAGFD